MNTKQAIYFLENKVEDVGMPTPVINERINDVIELLQRGEKYKAIVKEMKKFTSVMVMWRANDKIFELEQKYFPKLSKGFTEKVMDKINNEGGI